jgi:hypothetical protein
LIAPRLSLQAAARAHPVEIPIEIELQQIARIIRRPAGLIELRVSEALFGQVELRTNASIKRTGFSGAM